METLKVTMDREGFVVLRHSVGANTTVGTGINSTHETSRDFSNGGFIVNGSVEMDVDVLGNDQACTLFSDKPKHEQIFAFIFQWRSDTYPCECSLNVSYLSSCIESKPIGCDTSCGIYR